MKQVTFIQSAADNLEAIQVLMQTHESSEPIRIAIAFWGAGVEELFEDCQSRKFEIICNLTAGGTNPKVIRFLRSMSNISIVQLNTLHAKVLIADGGALISSANASTNGLALEGATASTWQEAGVVVPWKAVPRSQFIAWFNELWALSQPIEKADLEHAELLWSQRERQFEGSEGSSKKSDELTEALTIFRTFGFKGRAPMIQVYIRSAAALLALGGCNGEIMPATPFKFLFSGGTTRAFKHHENKFVEGDGGVRLKTEFVGHFVGSDGRVSSCPSKGRFKSLSDDVVCEVASWMVGRGALPHEIEGEVIEGRFFLR